MAKLKITKTGGRRFPKDRDYELCDTAIPGFLVKVTPVGRKTFMIAYVAHNGQRRKPAIGRYEEITVEQARGIAQDWLSEVRRGVDPKAERVAMSISIVPATGTGSAAALLSSCRGRPTISTGRKQAASGSAGGSGA